MPLPRSMIGRSTAPIVHDLDAEWLHAFAAAVGGAPRVTHPLFPVCIEWPAVIAAARLDDGALRADERRRGIHLTHDLTLHRTLLAADVLTTTATVDALEPHRRGTFERLRLDTFDAAGALVATTVMGSLFLGVAIAGAPDPHDAPDLHGAPDPHDAPERGATDPTAPRGDPPIEATRVSTAPLTVAADQALVYSKASRIWNPIHTDATAAIAAGLPAPILHGTCTLAMATSAALTCAGLDYPHAVRRVRARFGTMVLMPSRLELRVTRPHDDELHFAVHDEHDVAVIRDGRLRL